MICQLSFVFVDQRLSENVSQACYFSVGTTDLPLFGRTANGGGGRGDWFPMPLVEAKQSTRKTFGLFFFFCKKKKSQSSPSTDEFTYLNTY
jgi:hypothetical protein